MRHLNLLPVVFGLSVSTFACSGGVQHDSPSNITYSAPMLLACADGSTSSVIATGDFNGDKLPDLVGCETKDSVSVFLNAGAGFFGDAISVQLESTIFWVDAEDVDGDGKSDIIWSHGSDIGVTYSNGDGTFGRTIAQANFPDGCNAYKYSLDGFENAICYENGKVIVYDMASDGSGQQAFTLAAPATPTVLDVDHDGHLDFAYAIGSSIAVQLNLGDNTFGPVQVVVVTGARVNSLQPVDIDGDTYTDLIADVGSSSTGEAYAFLHNEAGTGFKDLGDLPKADHVSYQFQDVTGDFVMDLVLAQDGALVVMVGKGDGNFEDQGVALTGPWTSSSQAKFTDLNGDGKPDLVVGGSSVSVLLRQ